MFLCCFLQNVLLHEVLPSGAVHWVDAAWWVIDEGSIPDFVVGGPLFDVEVVHEVTLLDIRLELLLA